MNVIGHQDVGMHRTTATHGCGLHAFEVEMVIAHVHKTRLTIIATLNDMLWDI
jgi:hypothetical protein